MDSINLCLNILATSNWVLYLLYVIIGFLAVYSISRLLKIERKEEWIMNQELIKATKEQLKIIVNSYNGYNKEIIINAVKTRLDTTEEIIKWK